MFTDIKDKYGNMIYEKNRSIFLYLKDRGETRKLWAISPKWELFIRRFDKHIFRKLDAYWFNYSLLKRLNPEMRVVVKEEDGTLLNTTAQDILQKWDNKRFVSDWFELQIFMPRNLFLKK